MLFFFFQAEDGIRDYKVTGVQTCALPISPKENRRTESSEETEPARDRQAGERPGRRGEEEGGVGPPSYQPCAGAGTGAALDVRGQGGVATDKCAGDDPRQRLPTRPRSAARLHSGPFTE